MSSLTIKLDKNVSQEDATLLTDIANKLREEIISVQTISEHVEGTKGDIPLAIEIINVSLKGITTILAILQYFRGNKPKYTMEYEHNGIRYKVENLTAEQSDEIAEKLSKSKQQATITISTEQ